MLMSMQCIQVFIVFYGAKNSNYFAMDKEDGFKVIRYVSLTRAHCF